MSEKMSIEDRIKRDGHRWRYIYLLERELERRKTRHAVLAVSMTLNLFLIGVCIARFS